MQESPKITHSPISPSFNSYSSEKLAEIAARVVQEIANDPQPLPDDSDHPNIFSWNVEEDQLDRHFQSLNVDDDRNDAEEEQNDDEDDDDFEFAVVWKEADSSSTSVADEIFYNGQIRPVYPLFNTALLSNQEQEELSISHVLNASKETTTPKKSTRSPLGKLFDEDRGEATTSCSSSEADELDGVSSATYCVWAPGKAAEENRRHQRHDSPADGQRCKKSHSTGSSKRWKLRDLVFRSHSDGKETFVFLAPSSKKSVTLSGGYAKKAQEVKGSVSVQDLINNNYIRGVRKFGDKRRSFLPYRQDLVGIFSNNVHGLNKNLHPF